MSLLLLLNKLLSTTIQLKEMNMLKTKDDLHNYLQEDHNKVYENTLLSVPCGNLIYICERLNII